MKSELFSLSMTALCALTLKVTESNESATEIYFPCSLIDSLFSNETFAVQFRFSIGSFTLTTTTQRTIERMTARIFSPQFFVRKSRIYLLIIRPSFLFSVVPCLLDALQKPGQLLGSDAVAQLSALSHRHLACLL